MVISESDYLTHTIDDFRDFAREDNEKEDSDIYAFFKHALEIFKTTN